MEAYGWPTFYLFSVAAAVPGLILLLVCRQTLEYTRQHAGFLPRIHFARGYRFALQLLMLGSGLLGLCLLALLVSATGLLHLTFAPYLLEFGAAIAIAGVLCGGVLDYLALRKARLLAE